MSDSLGELLDRLASEHLTYPLMIDSLERMLGARNVDVAQLRAEFKGFKDSLMQHVIDEESEVYPEVARMGLLDFSVSAIMQQHQEVTDGLARMEAAMAKDDWAGALKELHHLADVLDAHQSAEEKEVFPLAIAGLLRRHAPLQLS